ncbi:MAG TPA: alpha-amylase family glycosyl hydrolase, partial [Longimicrobiales bacterium]|nr:alpha-amylase family glycosyl hydrolase [Longimicrobiales bacterium]
MPTLRATFRIQFRPDFDLSAAADVADYLAALGVSHLYASPYLQAAPGSTHGYDVVDPTRVSRDLGGEAGHQRLTRSLDRAGLGQVLDIVPNHMSVAEGNAWWWDVLRNGPASRHANVFDVDWDPPEAKLRNQVLMPILGDHYGRELEAGHLRLERVGAEFVLRYHDRAIPVGTASLPPLLERAATLLMEPPDPPADGRTLQFPGPATAPPTSGDGEDPASPDMTRAEELAFLARSLRRLPDAGAEDAGLREARRRDLDVVEGRLRDLTARPAVVRALDRAVRELNEDVEALDDLVSVQNYRLAYWRTAGQELDYRRFFDIDNLAAIRTEDPRVFEAVHDLPLRWVREGVLDGLRVDHPDGLRLPAEYFRRLREAAPGAWIVVEKILMPDEALRPWPVDGTTGYDFLNMVTGLFLEPSSGDAFTALWRTVSGDDRPFHDVALEARDQVLRDVLAADLNRLANVFVQVCEARRRYRDFTRSD